MIRKAGRGSRSLAARADKHACYEASVQDPESEVAFVSRTFRRLTGRPARTLREDFCGTAVFSLAWAQSHRERRAWGIDLDEPTLAYARDVRHADADAAVLERVELMRANVLDGATPKVDVGVGFNFSYWTFKSRDRLRRYFEVAREGLVDDGVLFLDAYGGSEATKVEENAREVDDFVYRWDQAAFNPLTNELQCHIHFDFDDGSSIERAFSYDWRMWTLPELRELLLEAGFSDVQMWWERTDAEGDGTGRWYQPKRPDHEGVWWTYIAALR